MWVVEMTIWVDFAEDAQAQPAEVLFTGGAGHLVAAIYFLERDTETRHEGTRCEIKEERRSQRGGLTCSTVVPPAGGALPVYLFHSGGSSCSSR